MFRSLKEKLKLFKKKAVEELQERSGESGSKGQTEDDARVKAKLIKKAPESIVRKKAVERVTGPARDKPEVEVKPKPERKRSQRQLEQGVSLKRKIELETAELKPWEKVEEKPISDSEKVGWFAKSITPSKLDSILWNLEVALLESDVALPVIDKIKDSIKKELLEKKFKPGADVDKLIETALRNAIISVLQSEIIHFDKFIEKTAKPVKLMFVGVNGTGKTSAIAKLAFRFKKQKKACVIAAGDTFRAGAIEQLEKHAKKLGIKLIKDKAGSDPAAIAFDSIEHAKARHKDVVLIDTAGRMQTNVNLMDEMKKIQRVAKPDMIIFVGDALAGNDVVEQAKQFENVVGLDAAILTKLDADAKGGAALSIAYAVGKPILFFSVGQRYGDIVPFNAEWLVNRLFE